MIVLVLILAGLGGVLRFLLTQNLNSTWPWGTLAANVLASGLLGYLAGQSDLPPAAISIGFLGALSTWSTVAAEIMGFFDRERPVMLWPMGRLPSLLASVRPGSGSSFHNSRP